MKPNQGTRNFTFSILYKSWIYCPAESLIPYRIGKYNLSNLKVQSKSSLFPSHLPCSLSPPGKHLCPGCAYGLACGAYRKKSPWQPWEKKPSQLSQNLLPGGLSQRLPLPFRYLLPPPPDFRPTVSPQRKGGPAFLHRLQSFCLIPGPQL